MYKKILIPLDCSSVDDVIVSHIINLCEVMKPKVYLLRVLHVHTRDALNYSDEETKKCLEKIETKFNKKEISNESLIEYGEPESVIPRIAKEINCDLIAFATHGHKKLLDFLLGTVVEKVRHEVEIPILLIKAPLDQNKL